ncbi:MAG: methyltransferase domain-containing protein [Labilithrix sp.]
MKQEVREAWGEDGASEPRPPPESLEFPPATAARTARAEVLAHVLRRGRTVSDDAFDEIYPPAITAASAVHWTPVRVAARVVELLAMRENERLIDVGSGAGKFCIVAAAMSRARVQGIEHRPELVAVAREAARRMKIDVEFVESTFHPSHVESCDAAYFFNPFALPILLPGIPVYAADRYAGVAAEDVARAEEFFASARRGMRIVTYCGFGGVVPAGYERHTREPWAGGWLELFEKVS